MTSIGRTYNMFSPFLCSRIAAIHSGFSFAQAPPPYSHPMEWLILLGHTSLNQTMLQCQGMCLSE